jgi:hypothetical protein
MSELPHALTRSTCHRRGAIVVASLCGFGALAVVPSASAQYTYNPANADEQGNTIRLFGSAKDDKGALLPGVTILLDATSLSYVAVTDEQGRFRVALPKETWAPEKVAPSCFKQGFVLVRVTKRPGTGPKPTMQVDCVLRRANPA